MASWWANVQETRITSYMSEGTDNYSTEMGYRRGEKRAGGDKMSTSVKKKVPGRWSWGRPSTGRR